MKVFIVNFGCITNSFAASVNVFMYVCIIHDMIYVAKNVKYD